MADNIKIPASASSARDAGIEGERSVGFELMGLPSDYIPVRKLDGMKSLVLAHQDFPSKKNRQEFDHLIVGPQGVFDVETKSFSGKLIIDPDASFRYLDKWRHIKDIHDPFRQSARHANLLRLIFGLDIPIISCICMANSGVIIKGREYSPVPIVDCSDICSFIKNSKDPYTGSRKLFSLSEQRDIVKLIEKYRQDISRSNDLEAS